MVDSAMPVKDKREKNDQTNLYEIPMPTNQQSSNTRRCPHCGAEIDHLYYVADVTNWGWESGSCDLDGDNWDYDGDSETTNSETQDTRYECPECHADIGTVDIWPGEEEPESEEPPPPPEPEDMEEEPTARFWLSANKQNQLLYTCPDCKAVRWLDQDEVEDIQAYNSKKDSNPKGRYHRTLVACGKCWAEHASDTNNTVEY